MSFEFIRKLPTPDEIRKEYPMPERLVRLKEERDQEIRDVITGKSNKFLVIIGPCSADNEDAVCDYLARLAKVNEKVKDKLILIPRIYTNKPRTTGEGYKGIVHQPDPEKKPDFLQGLIAMRKCTFAPSMNPALPLQMKCFILKTGVIFPIFSLMWLSARAPWRINSTALPSAALTSPQV